MSNPRMRSLTAGIVAALLTGAIVAGLYELTKDSAATASVLPPEKTQGQVVHLRGGNSNDQKGAIQPVVSRHSWGLLLSHGPR
jgi:hypothetical protein